MDSKLQIVKDKISMKILVVGNIDQFEELKLKFGADHVYSSLEDSDNPEGYDPEVVFDFVAEEIPESLENYEKIECPVFFSIVKTSLAHQNIYYPVKDQWFGFNGLPTFINRELLEVSIFNSKGEGYLSKIAHGLKTDYVLVEDRVGMVSPRVVCMIINEAFYTNAEGTASEKDIDLAMKLGTNYPLGPFEWAEKIGIENVYEVLEAVYEDTGDERYKINPQLKKKYLKEITR